MKVAIVSGVCIPHDAISNAVLQERSVLVGEGHDVAIYCQGTTMESDPGIFPGADPWLMSQHAGYHDADLAILHFGTAYELFDALLLDPSRSMKRVVRFHNVTPPELLDGVHRRRAQQGLDQVVIAERSDHIWCDSEYNRATLVELGIPEAMTSVLRLCAPDLDELLTRVPGPYPEVPRILFVGRMVRAKGVLDLLEAYRIAGLAAHDVELCFAGNARQSDPQVIAALHRAGDMPDSGIEVVEDPSDEALADLYESASVFAMPSYHEGFCVPVVEAMARGLRVVTSDAGALPETVGDNGQRVPPGAPQQLAIALRDAIQVARSEPTRRTWENLDEYSLQAFTASFLAAVADVVGSHGRAGLSR